MTKPSDTVRITVDDLTRDEALALLSVLRRVRYDSLPLGTKDPAEGAAFDRASTKLRTSIVHRLLKDMKAQLDEVLSRLPKP